MSYHRVLPRDLFNEANLLKCLGRLILLIEDRKLDLAYEHDGDPFNIEQDQSDGSIRVTNLDVSTAGGERLMLYRPLNARDPWPLMCGDDREVFDDAGNVVIDFAEAAEDLNNPPAWR